MRTADPGWWWSGTHEGRPVREALARRDITSVFRFLKSRGWGRAAIAAATGLSENRVREIFHGRQQVTSYEVLERIATGLRIDRGLLGMAYHDQLPQEPVDPPERRGVDVSAGFVGALAPMAVGSAAPDLGAMMESGAPVHDVPRQVTGRHVEVLRAVSEQHRQFDAELGGGPCRDSAASYLRWARGLLHGRFDSARTERDLKAVLSDLHQIVGWACHDLGDHANARRYLTAGLTLARDIDDLVLVSGAFYRLGRVSIHQARAAEALKLWQLGQIVAQDSGCLVSVAVLHANEAWAYAMLGAEDHVRDALARAEGELARVDAATVPAWARFFLAPADIDGISAVVYSVLATHEQYRARYAPATIERATRAVSKRRPGEERSRTFDTISLATGYVLDGQPDPAADHGHRAVDSAMERASVRAVDRLRGMAALARSYRADAGVSAVLDRVEAMPAG